MKRLAILLNIIAPYRIPILASLAESFETLVLHGGTEPNRTWTLELPPFLRTHKVFTVQIPIRETTGFAGVSDTTYLHLNLGLVWWLLRFRPHIVLSNEMGLRTVIAAIYGKVARVPVWVWWGGTVHSERNISNSKRLLRFLLARQIKRWISYGSTSTQYLESIGVGRKRILQIQNCVPQATYHDVSCQRHEWFKSYPRPVILSVGQLVQRKGYDRLIEACGRLASRGAQFTLIIVGQGPEQHRLEELATKSQIEHFEVLPNQAQCTLSEIYRASDVFVFPTLEDVWGLVVNEAMWSGTPVLCSQYAGCAADLLSESNIFDPLSEHSFDLALAKIFDRSIEPPDRSSLQTSEEVSDMICRSLLSGSPIENFSIHK